MALTESTMMPIGTLAPGFNLKDVCSGKYLGFEDIQGKNGTLVFFICNHCPYVKHINSELVKLGNDFIPKGIGFAAISSNDIEAYPQDGPEEMKKVALEEGYGFPYLFDSSQEVAKVYDAACTPDFFLFSKHKKLVYRGRLDPSTPGNGVPLTGADLRAAMEAMLVNGIISEIQYPSMGCNIKWKK